MTIKIFIPISVPGDSARYEIPYEDLDHKEEAFCVKYGFDSVPEGTVFHDDIDVNEVYKKALAALDKRLYEDAI